MKTLRISGENIIATNSNGKDVIVFSHSDERYLQFKLECLQECGLTFRQNVDIEEGIDYKRMM